MGRLRPATGLLVAALAALTACRGAAGGGDELVLDGRPRIPDVEGVVTDISFDEITLDGNRTYGVAGDLVSFSTYDLGPVPMLHRQGQYVQVGLVGDVVTWMAGIGVVVRAPQAPPVVFYTGVLVHIDDDRRAVFADGTVLRLADGVESPVPEGPVRAEIDPERHVVRALVLT